MNEIAVFTTSQIDALSVTQLGLPPVAPLDFSALDQILPPMDLGMTPREKAFHKIKDLVLSQRFEEAILELDRAADNFGDEAGIHADKAYCYRHMDQALKACEEYHRAIEMGFEENPNRAQAASILWSNYATALIDLGNYDGAIRACIASMQCEMNVLAAWQLCTTALLVGQWEAAWKLWHHRLAVPGFQIGADYHVPVWTGEERPQRILLVGEQGIGDRILYASLFKETLAKANTQVMIELAPQEMEKLEPLFNRSFPDMVTLSVNDSLQSAGTAQCLVGDLVKMFRPTVESFPKDPEPFLVPDPGRKAHFRAFAELGKPVVGISWASANREFGRFKSRNLIDLAPILKIPGITFVNLQYGHPEAEIAKVEAELGITIHQPMTGHELFHDVDGAAALVAACDHVVTVSNINAHLAGGLGIPTTLLLGARFGKIWYWMAERSDCLWYPRTRIFRRDGEEQWSALIERAATHLGGLFDGFAERRTGG